MRIKNTIEKPCTRCGKIMQLIGYSLARRRFCSRSCARNSPTLEQRFWSKVHKTDTCWLWQASKDQAGYGTFRTPAGVKRAHRVAWELTKGAIPNGLWALHKCDVPACVFVDHLFLGDQDANMKDMAAKGRSANFDGEKSPNAKLTQEQAEEIIRLWRTPDRSKWGRKFAQGLADRFGVSKGLIYFIVQGRAWKHLSRD